MKNDVMCQIRMVYSPVSCRCTERLYCCWGAGYDICITIDCNDKYHGITMEKVRALLPAKWVHDAQKALEDALGEAAHPGFLAGQTLYNLEITKECDDHDWYEWNSSPEFSDVANSIELTELSKDIFNLWEKDKGPSDSECPSTPKKLSQEIEALKKEIEALKKDNPDCLRKIKMAEFLLMMLMMLETLEPKSDR